ncbi:MAG: tetratricopeptide repeat protein [Bacteroidia bacterium]
MKRHFLASTLVCLGMYAASAQTLKDAIRMTESERYEAASATFKKLLKSGDDQGGDTWFYYGDNFFEWDVLDSARMMFQKGTETKPSNPLNFTGLGSVAWMEHNAELARQNFYKATSLTTTQAKELPKSKQVQVYLNIAQAYLSNPKSLPDALTNINAAMKIDPKNPDVYVLLGDYGVEKNITDVSEPMKNYEKASELDKTSAKALMRLGQMSVRVQNWDEGLKYYNQAVKMDSTFAPVFRARGDLYLNAGKYKQAISDYKKYLSMNNSTTAREKYAQALYFTKEYKMCIDEMKEVQKKDSSSLVIFRLMSYSYYEANDYGPGLKNMENFLAKQKIKNKPKLIALDYQYYGKLLAKTGQEDKGIEQINKAIALDSSNVETYGDIATIYYNSKRYTDAAKYYKQKIRMSKKVNVLDYNSLGQAFYKGKEFGKADTAFMKLAETEGYSVFGNAWRGKCNFMMENQEKPEGKAKPYYELVIQKGSKDVERNKKDLISAYSYLGFYYFVQKNYDCAKAAFLKLQELDPANEKAKSGLEDKFIKAASGTCELVKPL